MNNQEFTTIIQKAQNWNRFVAKNQETNEYYFSFKNPNMVVSPRKGIKIPVQFCVPKHNIKREDFENDIDYQAAVLMGVTVVNKSLIKHPLLLSGAALSKHFSVDFPPGCFGTFNVDMKLMGIYMPYGFNSKNPAESTTGATVTDAAETAETVVNINKNEQGINSSLDEKLIKLSVALNSLDKRGLLAADFSVGTMGFDPDEFTKNGKTFAHYMSAAKDSKKYEKRGIRFASIQVDTNEKLDFNQMSSALFFEVDERCYHHPLLFFPLGLKNKNMPLSVNESFSVTMSDAWRLEHSASNGIYSHENVRDIAELSSDYMVRLRKEFMNSLLERFVDDMRHNSHSKAALMLKGSSEEAEDERKSSQNKSSEESKQVFENELLNKSKMSKNNKVSLSINLSEENNKTLKAKYELSSFKHIVESRQEANHGAGKTMYYAESNAYTRSGNKSFLFGDTPFVEMNVKAHNLINGQHSVINSGLLYVAMMGGLSAVNSKAFLATGDAATSLENDPWLFDFWANISTGVREKMGSNWTTKEALIINKEWINDPQNSILGKALISFIGKMPLPVNLCAVNNDHWHAIMAKVDNSVAPQKDFDVLFAKNADLCKKVINLYNANGMDNSDHVDIRYAKSQSSDALMIAASDKSIALESLKTVMAMDKYVLEDKVRGRPAVKNENAALERVLALVAYALVRKGFIENNKIPDIIPDLIDGSGVGYHWSPDRGAYQALLGACQKAAQCEDRNQGYELIYDAFKKSKNLANREENETRFLFNANAEKLLGQFFSGDSLMGILKVVKDTKEKKEIAACFAWMGRQENNQEEGILNFTRVTDVKRVINRNWEQLSAQASEQLGVEGGRIFRAMMGSEGDLNKNDTQKLGETKFANLKVSPSKVSMTDASIAFNEELVPVRFERLVLGLCNYLAERELQMPSGREGWNNRIAISPENIQMVIEHVGQWALSSIANKTNPNFGTHRLMSVDEAVNQPFEELMEVMRLGSSWYGNSLQSKNDKVKVMSI